MIAIKLNCIYLFIILYKNIISLREKNAAADESKAEYSSDDDVPLPPLPESSMLGRLSSSLLDESTVGDVSTRRRRRRSTSVLGAADEPTARASPFNRRHSILAEENVIHRRNLSLASAAGDESVSQDPALDEVIILRKIVNEVIQ